MNEKPADVFEDFRRGGRLLFIVKSKGKDISELTEMTDIVLKKISNSCVGIMFWRNAADAERFILDNGWHEFSEVYEINVNQLSMFVVPLLNKYGFLSLSYVLF